MRALVIDDSRVIRAILKQSLQRLRFDVVEAGNGREALEQLRRIDRPDLILVDWNMPEMNGLEFVQAIRADAAFSDVRLMMVTTEHDAAQVTRALEAGADEYLMKPFTHQSMEEKLLLLGLTT
jgi:two-component system chemotaxis response regulator CheY